MEYAYCAWCKKRYVRQMRGHRFCSRLCRHRYWDDTRHVDRLAWDGVMQHSAAPFIRLWRIYCVCCGADSWHRLTLEEATALKWLPPCKMCSGARWLEEDCASRDPVKFIGNEAVGSLDGPNYAPHKVVWWSRSA